MKASTPKIIVSGVCALLSLQPIAAHALLIARDDFDYSSVGSDLTGNGAGNSLGFAASWSGQTSFNIGAGSLVSPRDPLPLVGNSVTAVAFAGNRDIDRPLSSTLGADGTSAYLGILIQPQGILHQGSDNGWFAAELIGSTTVLVGMSSFGDAYGLEVAGTRAATTRNAVIGRSEFFVIRIDFTEGVDPVYLYVNPQPGGPEPSVPSASLINFNIASLDKVRLTGPGAAAFDAIRIGTTFLDVAPPVSDFNNSGKVDETDLAVLLNNFGSTVATPSQGDTNADLDVDGADLLVWQRQAGAAYSPPTTTAIPEPASAMLAIGAAWLLTISKRLRQ